MISILDYGAGNLRSVSNTLDALGFEFEIVQSAAGLARASRIVLPGVGHFGQMMRALDEMAVRATLVDRIQGGVPFLGICLGLQALLQSSEEAPEVRGLGIFAGQVRRFQPPLRVPHMGWNQVASLRPFRLFDGAPHFYFANSYYAPIIPATAAVADYGEPFTAAIEHENIFAVQFHLEKSGPAGLDVMRRFAELPEC